MKNRMFNKFITLEGVEGAGKSTQINLLAKYLESNNIPYIITREPGGTPLAEKLRDIIKHYENETISPTTELLLIEAARAQHVENVIKVALKQNKCVICDRFIDSSTAYQGFGRGIEIEKVERLNNFAINGCIPDATIIFDIDTENSFQRFSNRVAEEAGIDRFESETEQFHQKIRQGFLHLAKEYPERIKIINASKSIEEVHQLVIGALNELL